MCEDFFVKCKETELLNKDELKEIILKFLSSLNVKKNQKLKSPIFDQKHSELSQFEALYKHSLPPNFHPSSCSTTWARRV